MLLPWYQWLAHVIPTRLQKWTDKFEQISVYVSHEYDIKLMVSLDLSFSGLSLYSSS